MIITIQIKHYGENNMHIKALESYEVFPSTQMYINTRLEERSMNRIELPLHFCNNSVLYMEMLPG